MALTSEVGVWSRSPSAAEAQAQAAGSTTGLIPLAAQVLPCMSLIVGLVLGVDTCVAGGGGGARHPSPQKHGMLGEHLAVDEAALL